MESMICFVLGLQAYEKSLESLLISLDCGGEGHENGKIR